MTREYVTIPKEAWDFLCGQGELDGVSFGERHPTRFGLYWWRSYIAALTAPAPAADDVALVDDYRDWVAANAGLVEGARDIPAEHKARAALLARFAAIRRETIEACARVADTDSGQGYEPYEAAERIAKNIRALAGKEK